MRRTREILTPSSERDPLEPRRVRAIGGVSVVVFLALAAWGLGGDPVAEGTEPGLPPPPVVVSEETSAAAAPRVEPAETPTSPEEPLTSGWVSPPRDISKLLDARFWVRGDGATYKSLGTALAGPRSVGVVNLWATYCAPCRNEFPGFRRLQQGWGNQVRFVPIQLGNDDPGDLATVMPESPSPLVDTTAAGVVQSVLVKSGLLPPDPPIPITLLLDCKRRLRWIQIGEVKDMAGFDANVAKLRDELGTASCSISQEAKPADAPHDPERPGLEPPKQQKPDGQCPPCRPDHYCQVGAGGYGICMRVPR